MKTRHSVLCIVLCLLILIAAMPDLAQAEPRANTYVVNSNAETPDANPGDGICDIGVWLPYCTLRAALEEANVDGVETIIHFAQSFTGSDYIPGCSLPNLTEPLTTIDASDQWDTVNNRPGVEILGADCASLDIRTDRTTVRGLLLLSSGTLGFGIRIFNGNFNLIGGTDPGQRNVFITGEGIELTDNSNFNWILGNYFGTIDGIYAQPSKTGISLGYRTSHTLIEENLIVGHSNPGIEIAQPTTEYVTIKDNIIGLNATKNATLPNTTGIYIGGASHNTIEGNTISGNTGHGIELVNSSYNLIGGANTIGGWVDNLGNGGDGIHIGTGSISNTITGTAGIRFNGGYGVYIDGDSNAILGTTVEGNTQDGVYITNGSDNRVGSAGHGNEITENGASGVHLGAGANGTIVAGNYIGLGDGGQDNGNQNHGIYLEGTANNLIGGEKPGEGNWIGFNAKSGIYLSGATATGNLIIANMIGAPITWGWPAPNGNHGIAIYNGPSMNTIGTIGGGNTILANHWSGVAIVNSDNNAVSGNFIGTDGADIHWGNGYHGIDTNGTGNNIAFNEIAFNGSIGVRIDTGISNWITANSIHENGAAGITLVGNGNQNLTAPVISQASCQGPVSGTACAGCTVEIFSDTDDEGEVYEGTAIADSSTGVFSWNGAPSGPHVTTTAIDSAHNTSAFASAFQIPVCNSVPQAAFSVSPGTGTLSTVFQFDASASSDLQDPTSLLLVRWDWENDGTYDTNWSTTKTASHTFNSYGLHTVRLLVKDSGDLTDAAIRSLWLSNPKTAYFSQWL